MMLPSQFFGRISHSVTGPWPPFVAEVTPENVRFTCSLSLHIVSNTDVRASENDMQTLTDYGSESTRLLSNDLLNRQTIRSMAKLNTLSFTTVTGLHRSIVDWWLRQEDFCKLLQALPKSCVNVEFDTAGYDRPLPEC